MSQVLKSTNYEIFYILSITDKNKSIWKDPNLLKIQSHKRGPVLDQYVWSMIGLSKLASDNFNLKNKYFNINNSKAPWKLLPINKSTESQGNSVVEPVDNIYPITTFMSPNSQNFKIEGDFEFNPLVGQDNFIPFRDAYKVIYDLTVFPSMPFLVSSTIPGTSRFGPLFPKRVQYNISTDQALSIRVDYEGSKFIKIFPNTATVVQNVNDYTFRTLRSFDMKYDYAAYEPTGNIYDSIEELNNNYISLGYGSNFNEKIISLTLTSTQRFEFEVTAKAAKDDFYYAFKNEQGPQYCRMVNRTVSGTIVFSTPNPNFNPFERNSLTLYFGSIFLFSMSKVHWQRPKIEMVSNNLYTIEFDFIASAVDNAVVNGFRYGGYCSEFLIPTSMSGPIRNG